MGNSQGDAEKANTPHLNPLPQGVRQGIYRRAPGFRRRQVVADKEDIENKRFCETNRIGFMMKTGDNVLRSNWMRSKRVGISIRFVWNENSVSTTHLNPLLRTSVWSSERLVGLGLRSNEVGGRETVAQRRRPQARRPRHERTRRGIKHAILPNEPTVFSEDFFCITSIFRYLCRLQRRFAGGFVLENEPTGGCFFWVFTEKWVRYRMKVTVPVTGRPRRSVALQGEMPGTGQGNREGFVITGGRSQAPPLGRQKTWKRGRAFAIIWTSREAARLWPLGVVDGSWKTRPKYL